MDEKLKSSLKNEINKSGYPLELEIVELLREDGFLVSPNLSYLNSFQQLDEIDIIALKPLKENNDGKFGKISIALLIECKKSKEKPWVFFEEVLDPAFLLGHLTKLKILNNLQDIENSELLVGSMNTELSGHHYNSIIPIARTYFEAFKNLDSKSNIFEATKSLWEAGFFFRNWFRRKSQIKSLRNNEFQNQIIFYHSVIIADTNLVLAQKNNDNFDIQETDRLLLRSIDSLTESTNDIFPFSNEILIDVVKKEYFKNYLDTCNKELEMFAKHIKRIFDAGWLKNTDDF